MAFVTPSSRNRGNAFMRAAGEEPIRFVSLFRVGGIVRATFSDSRPWPRLPVADRLDAVYDGPAMAARPIAVYRAVEALLTSAVTARSGLLIVVALFVGTVVAHVDAIPFWDAKLYLDCVEAAVHQPFDLLNYRCFGHPSIFYLGIWGLTQYVKPWSPSAIYFVNAALGAASIVAFHGLVGLLFPKRRDVEHTLVAALYGLAPVFLSHAIILNVDYGATCCFVLFLYFLVAGRYWWAGALAIATAFSKETGAAACGLAIVADVVAFVLQPRLSWSQRIAALRARGPLVALPIAIGVYVLFVAVVRQGPQGIIGAYAPTGVIADVRDAVLNTNLADPSIRAFLADIFVLNFQWLYSAVIAAAIGAALIRVGPAGREDAGVERSGIFIGLSLAGLVYIVTRYRFSNAARYVLLASPMLVLAFYRALASLAKQRALRLVYLSVCAVLVLLSNFRTLDPVSRSLFGTIRFGSHALLDRTSFFGNLKLDCMAYNLEVLNLQYLYRDAVRDVRPAIGSLLLMGNAIYEFPPTIDGRTYELTSEPTHALPLVIAIGERHAVESHVRREGERFFYVAFPNADNLQLPGLLNAYELISKKQYERHGYTVDLYTFRFSSG